MKIDEKQILAEFFNKTEKEEPLKEDIESWEFSEPTEPSKQPKVNDNPKEISITKNLDKEVKALEKYKETFLAPPKITDRKTAYLSRETRDGIDEIVRRFGMRGASVSGFIENLAKEHLRQYKGKFSEWKKL
ncbi:MAG: DUF3408 domain-containing protein [Flavobacteriaceae bacterium]|nr:DUF3408 domain-containing protein [Flavobacteriaceae bacterium]